MAVSLGEGETYFLGQGYVEAAPSEFYSSTVYAAGGNVINIQGGVAGLSSGIRVIGFSQNYQQNTSIYIGESGAVNAYYDAISLYGGGSTITNEGSIFAGAQSIGSEYTNVSFSYLHNTGSIVAGNLTISGLNAAIYTNSTAGEEVQIRNSGLIETQLSSGFAMALDGNSVETIKNTGEIIGNVRLGAGDDTFVSKNGTVDGSVAGGEGADALRGSGDDDRLSGDAGADILQGGLGGDKLTGGTESDVFLYKAIGESTPDADGRDLINDFSVADADKIDLSYMDANSAKNGNQAFKFIGTDDFNEIKGEVHYIKNGASTTVEADLNGDGTADFAVKLMGAIDLSKSDFIL